MSYCIAYLVCPRSFEHGGVSRLDILAASLRTVRACLSELPSVLIFNEDYTEEDKAKLSSIVPCLFETVDFSIGDESFVLQRRHKGYMLMCRFWSGIVQRHPSLQGFTHYLRLDDDSYFINPKITQADIIRMQQRDYSYRQVFYDDYSQQRHLYQFSLDFLKQEGLDIPAHHHHLGQGYAVYNNFHFASLRFWNHPLVTRYVDALESAHGCLKHGFMDANIHMMILSLLVPHTDLVVGEETQFGYRHNHHCAGPGSMGIARWHDQFVVDPSEYA